MTRSPAALEGDVGLSAALGKGELPAATRERIALAVAELNGCDYCLSAHTYLGRNVAKLDDAEISANRGGTSNDVKAAGYTDAQIIEIVQHVALNTWTNYINTVGQTEIDFPVVKAHKAA
jgi:AhpD family alkylhydroperoxidase